MTKTHDSSPTFCDKNSQHTPITADPSTEQSSSTGQPEYIANPKATSCLIVQDGWLYLPSEHQSEQVPSNSVTDTANSATGTKTNTKTNPPLIHLPSPNHNQRPDGMAIDTIVIHNISLPPNEFAQRDHQGQHHVQAFFTNQLDIDAHPYFDTIKDLQVSAHVFIERDGRMTQFVSFDHRAWHAGQSSYLGRSGCNDFSIGIELEGSDTTTFTDAQYQALWQVVVAIHSAYPLTRRHVTGHSDIASGRKTDPGDGFDWLRFRQGIAEMMAD